MASWRRDGAAVIATISEDQEQLHEQLQSLLYGVEALESSTASRSRVLSLWEAYYALSQDHLLALPSNQSLHEIWLEFTASSSSFVSLYVVYHHFRQLGWLLRSGLNYGARFVLYRGDATGFHSEYIVHVHDSTTVASWHSVQALTRVAQDVKKTVILCEVGVAAEETEPHAASREGSEPAMATNGVYVLHGVSYTLDAVLIRFWDTAVVDEDRVDYAFTPQPMLLKKKKKAKSKKPKMIKETE